MTDPRNLIMQTDDYVANFRAERNRALTALDVDYAIARGVSPEAALIALHKARYECIEIEPELRHESRAWLEQGAYGRLAGLPWPPAGTLPE